MLKSQSLENENRLSVLDSGKINTINTVYIILM